MIKSTSVGILIGFFGLLVASLSGCALGAFFPTSIDVQLSNPSPLRGSAENIKTIAVSSPGVTGSGPGANEALANSLLGAGAIEITERLQRSGRFKIVTPNQLQGAILTAGIGGLGMASSMTESERTELTLKSGRAVNADAMIVLRGNRDMELSLGKAMIGRQEHKLNVSMTLISTTTGETIWSQEVRTVINQGLSTPSDDAIREAMLSRLVENFLQTVK